MASRGPIGLLWALAWIVFRWGGWPALVIFVYAVDPGGWFSEAAAPSPSPSAAPSPAAQQTPIPNPAPSGPAGAVLDVSTPGVLHVDFNWNGRFDGEGEAVRLAGVDVKDAFVANPAPGSWQEKALADLRERLKGKLVRVEWSGDSGYVMAPDAELVNARVLGSGFGWHRPDSGSRGAFLADSAKKAADAKKGLHAQ